MLIRALCDYYDLQQSTTAQNIPEGYEKQSVHYQVLLRENGEIAAIDIYQDIKELKQKNGKVKEVYVPREVNLPERSKKTATFSALIEHRPLYLFGLNYSDGRLTPDDKTDKARKSHEAFVRRNAEFFEDLNSPVCRAFYNFITGWKPEEQTENEHLKAIGKNYSGSYFIFALYDDRFKAPQDDPLFVEKYQGLLKKEDNDTQEEVISVCPIIGRPLPVARIHDKIKFPGGNTTGCVLVGMKESAYESYCKTQSYNSNISEAAMKKYTSAFNSLLSDRNHRILINTLVVVFFALKENDEAEVSLFSSFFGSSEKGDEDYAFSEVMRKLRMGIASDYSKLNIDENVEFYMAGFTPNASRISQKLLIHNSFGKIMENAAAHQKDMSLKGNDKQIYFGNIAKELISPKSTKEEVPSPLMTGIIRAAFEGGNYPEALLQTAVMRVKTDKNDDKSRFIKINFTRVGIIKACLNRKARKSNQEEELTMALNKDNRNPGYLCGRLFAVLEKIQQKAANAKLNTTIVDSYFSSACSRPASVFPRLIELNIHHMKKLDNDKLRTYYKIMMGEIVYELQDNFPLTLDTENQGSFIVGYFQQNQDLYTKKEN